jgi:phage/plasmid-associated DNA primase
MDNIEAEIKGKQSVNFTFDGVFVVSANKPTFHGDNNVAIKERKVDFPCLYKPSQANRRDLRPEFQSQISAFTAYILSIDPKWARDIINNASSIKLVKDLANEMAFRENNIEDYFDKRLVVDPNSCIQSSVLYKDYRSFCEENGSSPKSCPNFIPLLEELCNDSMGLGITKGRTKMNRYIKGLRLATVLDEYIEHPTSVIEMSNNVIGGVIVEPIQGKGGDGYDVADPINHDLCNKLIIDELESESESENNLIKNTQGCVEKTVSPTPKQPETNSSNGLSNGVGTDTIDTIGIINTELLNVGDRVWVKKYDQNGTVDSLYRSDAPKIPHSARIILDSGKEMLLDITPEEYKLIKDAGK